MSAAPGSRLLLGNFEIHHIHAGVYWWDGGALFGVVPRTLWGRKSVPDELNRIPLAFNCYLVKSDEHTLLIETGGGEKMDARARERMRLPAVPETLPRAIERHGFDPESIDIVVNSHLHWDHCGGNTSPDGTPAFPRAQYFACRGEWEHAHERLVRDSVSYLDANYDPLVNSGPMTLVEDNFEVLPGIQMKRAPGHNRDMMVVTAVSAGKTFCFLSDLVPSAAHLPPTWIAAFDLYPLETIETKTRWLNAAVEGNWICGFGHDADLAFACISHDPKSRFAAFALP